MNKAYPMNDSTSNIVSIANQRVTVTSKMDPKRIEEALRLVREKQAKAEKVKARQDDSAIPTITTPAVAPVVKPAKSADDRRVSERRNAERRLSERRDGVESAEKKLDTFSKFSQVPAYRRLLTHPSIPTAERIVLPSNVEFEDLIALELMSGEILIVVIEEVRRSTSFFQVRKEVAERTSSYKVVLADRLLIGEIIADFKNHKLNSESISDTDAEKFVFDLVDDAFTKQASDIHIIKRGHDVSVLYRMQGMATEITKWNWSSSGEKTMALVRSMYNTMSNSSEKSFKAGSRQDTDITKVVNGKALRLRYSHYPCAPNGIHVVLRLLRDLQGESEELNSKPVNTEFLSLGMSEEQQRDLYSMLRRPKGLLLVSGTTGSGKSTSIATALSWYRQKFPFSTMLTIEDPVEYIVPGVVQSSVVRTEDDRKDGINRMAEGVVSALRRDPDLIMIGEIRDAQTAEAAQQAFQTGHFVVSTLHATTCLDQIPRLENLGMSRFVMSAPQTWAGSMHQQLAKVVCPNCSVPFEEAVELGQVPADRAARVRAVVDGDVNSIRVKQSHGCEKCLNGIIGRTVCVELIMYDYKMLELIRDNNDLELYRYWRENGGVPIQKTAISKMQKGLVCPNDLEEEFEEIGLNERLMGFEEK